MTWSQQRHLLSYIRSSLWVTPIVAVVIELLVAAAAHDFDLKTRWNGFGLGVEGARALCNSVITLTLSFLVFSFGSLLVAIQVASGQYTPRIISTTLLSNNVIRYTVGLCVFTFLFAIKALNRTETDVRQFVVLLTGILGLCCLVAFIFFIDYAARLLRPVSLVSSVGEAGLQVIRSVYPQTIEADHTSKPLHLTAKEEATHSPETIVRKRDSSAIVLAVNVDILLAEAEKAKGVRLRRSPIRKDWAGPTFPPTLLPPRGSPHTHRSNHA